MTAFTSIADTRWQRLLLAGVGATALASTTAQAAPETSKLRCDAVSLPIASDSAAASAIAVAIEGLRTTHELASVDGEVDVFGELHVPFKSRIGSRRSTWTIKLSAGGQWLGYDLPSGTEIVLRRATGSRSAKSSVRLPVPTRIGDISLVGLVDFGDERQVISGTLAEDLALENGVLPKGTKIRRTSHGDLAEVPTIVDSMGVTWKKGKVCWSRSGIHEGVLEAESTIRTLSLKVGAHIAIGVEGSADGVANWNGTDLLVFADTTRQLFGRTLARGSAAVVRNEGVTVVLAAPKEERPCRPGLVTFSLSGHLVSCTLGGIVTVGSVRFRAGEFVQDSAGMPLRGILDQEYDSLGLVLPPGDVYGKPVPATTTLVVLTPADLIKSVQDAGPQVDAAVIGAVLPNSGQFGFGLFSAAGFRSTAGTPAVSGQQVIQHRRYVIDRFIGNAPFADCEGFLEFDLAVSVSVQSVNGTRSASVSGSASNLNAGPTGICPVGSLAVGFAQLFRLIPQRIPSFTVMSKQLTTATLNQWNALILPPAAVPVMGGKIDITAVRIDGQGALVADISYERYAR